MKRILSLMILLLTLASANANAWFFFFIPGSVTGAITDAITGDKGENCVGSNTKVGDTIRMPDGSYGTVKSLSSSSSSRCTNNQPIRALIDVSNSSQPYALSPITNKASIVPPTPVTTVLLPDGTWSNPVTPPVLPDGTWGGSDVSLVTNLSSAVVDTPAHVESSPPPPPPPPPPLAHALATPPSNTLPTQNISAADKLRDLKALYKDGVIDKKDFDTKKQEILKSM